MEEITITITILDRTYRLKIDREEEVAILNAVDQVNEKIREYTLNFALRDRQDLLAMVLLHFASNTSKMMKESESGIIEKLKELDRWLSKDLY